MKKLITLFLIGCSAVLSVLFLSRTSCAPYDEAWVARTFARMTLDEKIGQLCIISAVSDETTPTLNIDFMKQSPYRMDREYVQSIIDRYHVGGVIFHGRGTCQSQIDIINSFQRRSPIPLFIAQDLEWGLNMRLVDGMVFPHNLTLGAINDPDLVYQMFKEIGHQASTLGVHIIFAPVVDVNNNANNPVINDRSFGSNPHIVAENGIAVMRGLLDAGILSCAKHFPGHGDTSVDSHEALPIILHDLDRLNEIELYPFKQLINQGVPMVMIAHLCVPALDPSRIATTLSRSVVNDLLRKQLQFNGLIVSDGLGMKAMIDNYALGDLELAALRAGIDILLCPVDVPRAVQSIKNAITAGAFSLDELNARVLKILRAKAWAFSQHPESLAPSASKINSSEALALKKKLYEQLITLVRDENRLVPANNSNRTALIIIGTQDPELFSTTLSPLANDGIHHLAKDATESEVQNIVSDLGDADTIIIGIFGMNKYANQTFGVSRSTRACIAQLQQRSKQYILVLFGSPYARHLFASVGTLIIAYESDPDAQDAAARVILGTLKAHGTLPV